MDEVEVAVMLADISGSTALYEEIGNIEALKRVSVCLDLLRHVIEARGGVFVSSKGDDVLCTFDDPHAALEVGIEMFQTIQQNSLFLHAGLDFGGIIRARDDIFGDSVNMASRLSSLANAGEILCSQALYDRLELSHRAMVRYFGSRQFKGKAEPSNIYLFSDALPGQSTEIVFAHKPAQAIDEAPAADAGTAKAALRFGDETFVCSHRKPISMGRSPDCDLVVPQPWISRSHAFLEVLQDNVYLADNSSSGHICLFRWPSAAACDAGDADAAKLVHAVAGTAPVGPGAQVITCDVLGGHPPEDET